MTATTEATGAKPTDQDLPHPESVLVAMLPVTDIGASARFYGQLLGLTVLREFLHDGQVTGCSLSHPRAGFALSLRLRATLGAPADLRGEHPIIWRVRDKAALERYRTHADALGLSPTSRRHDDADLVAVVDPDGIDVLVGIPARPWDRFQGYELVADGYRLSHEQPLLDGG
ncbi:VOC family protein [Actinomycetospora chibensis]|uniref:VOC family protein n=1 Tax=Actinomycetospora chibensis TaxID=663606 RepID=A0ABV9RCL0_9PSEU|nr:VOC family protein [Actinomycetospora chibensis]MDD7922152.1 VOC family protein [Actinomycetospora chibensis]